MIWEEYAKIVLGNKKVTELKKHIIDGDIIQAVPSRRVQIECKAPALQVYGKLRKVNPSPYMFYIDFGTFKLTGASPESLITVKNRVATIFPSSIFRLGCFSNS